MSDAGSSDEAAPRKVVGRPFKKGESGNPAGLPKANLDFRERCRRAVDEHVIERWIKEIENNGDNWPEAAKQLAAYGYGKPTERHELTGSDGAPLIPLTRDEVLNALDESRRFRLQAGVSTANEPGASVAAGVAGVPP